MSRLPAWLAAAIIAGLVLTGCGASDTTTSGQAAQQSSTPSAPTASEKPRVATKPATSTPPRVPRSTAPSTAASDASATSRTKAKVATKSKAASSPRPQPGRSAPVTSVRGVYLNYAEWDGNRAAYTSNDVVLFFHASWCPKCRDTDASAKAGMPSGLTLVKVDYDSATKLRQQYGVTLQHTFVQVGDNGNVLKKWVGTYNDNSVAWVKAQTV